ncbi:MAG TPA: cache domain-containing protein [Vicinamibacterales bacterium]|nr:cache domain-containing protein [Vicinamibacterales bacterium]
MARHLPHINVRVFTVLVFVSLPLYALAAVMVLGTGQAQLRDAFGLQLTDTAQQAAATVDSYVFRRIIDVSILARVPDVQSAAAAGSRTPLDVARAREIDTLWVAQPGETAARLGLLETPASQFLRDIVSNDQAYREIVVTDRDGRVVAASNATSDYLQSDETWWKEAFGDGTRGRVSVSDVLWDESAKSHAIEITVPVTERPGERLVGVLKVVADARELLAVAGGVRSSTSGEVFLIREDGSIVFSQRGIGGQAKFFAADLFRERMKSFKAGDPQFRIDFSARDQNGRSYLVGIAPSQLGSSYPHLSWMLAVTQAEDELFAPARAQMWRMLGVFGLIAAAVLAIAVWFSLRLAAPPVGKDTHITEHPEVPRIEEESA